METDNKSKPGLFVECIIKYVFIAFDIAALRKSDGC